MKDGQPQILYLAAKSRVAAESMPITEHLIKRGLEVLSSTSLLEASASLCKFI